MRGLPPCLPFVNGNRMLKNIVDLIWFMQFIFYKSKCFQHFSWMNSTSLMLKDWFLFSTWYQIELFHLSSFRTLGLYIVNKLCCFFLLNILGTFYFKLDLVIYLINMTGSWICYTYTLKDKPYSYWNVMLYITMTGSRICYTYTDTLHER